MDDLHIRPLTVETRPELAAWFEAGGDAKSCWCQWLVGDTGCPA